MSKTQLSPYISFNGTCEEAMEFYKSVFGGTLEISRFGDFATPDVMPVEEDYKDKVMHSTLAGDIISFMASDNSPHGDALTVGNNISMSIAGDDEALLTKYFNGLSEGGSVTVPLSRQVWGDIFGMLVDKFGIKWMVNISSSPS